MHRQPTLFSAAYDAARNVTVVRGRVDSQSLGASSLTIDVYPSDSLSRFGHPEAEQWIAELNLSGSSSAEPEFTIEVEGDFRGRFITATNTRQQLTGWARPPVVRSHGDVTPNRHLFSVSADTSEISRPIVVQ